MANAAATLFKSLMDAKDMRCRFIDDDESVIRAGWNLENGSIAIYAFFADDNTDVHLEGRDFVKFPENKLGKMLQVVNELNSQYRWMKFVIDTEDFCINVKVDAVIQLDSCADETFELMIRMVQITEEAYPEIMKAVWA